VNWRFDGERAFVTRGGAWIGAVQAAWPTAELTVDSTSARLRSRPLGLFEHVALERAEVSAIVVRRGALGNGISFQTGTARGDDLVFWPTDATAVLDALRERGWPADAAAPSG
jgi:hypothetical protein